MTVAGALRIPRDFNRDGAAVALPLVGLFMLAHEFFLCSRSGRDITHAVSRSNRRVPCDAALRFSALAAPLAQGIRAVFAHVAASPPSFVRLTAPSFSSFEIVE